MFSCIHTVSLIGVLPCLSFFVLFFFFLPMVNAEHFPFSDCWSLFPVTLVPCFLVLAEFIPIIAGLPFT